MFPAAKLATVLVEAALRNHTLEDVEPDVVALVAVLDALAVP